MQMVISGKDFMAVRELEQLMDNPELTKEILKDGIKI